MRKFFLGLANMLGEIIIGTLWATGIIAISVTIWLIAYAILTWPMR